MARWNPDTKGVNFLGAHQRDATIMRNIYLFIPNRQCRQEEKIETEGYEGEPIVWNKMELTTEKKRREKQKDYTEICVNTKGKTDKLHVLATVHGAKAKDKGQKGKSYILLWHQINTTCVVESNGGLL